MSSLSSLTTRQWVVLLALLFLNLVCLYGGLLPLALGIETGREAVAPGPDAGQVAIAPTAAPGAPSPIATSPLTGTLVPTGTVVGRPLLTVTKSAEPGIPVPSTPGSVPSTATLAVRMTTTPSATVPRVRAPAFLSANALAALELNPRAKLASKSTFFTSACFGEGANPLQDKDFMTSGNWNTSAEDKCIFGYRVNPADDMPAKRYSVTGGSDGQPRFYIIPPDAFAQDEQTVKQWSLLRLTVDPEAGCAALGSIGMTADGIGYQCAACDFLRSGGICPGGDGSRVVALATHANYVLDANNNGGAWGFINYPTILFRKGLSVYFTGRSGYAPPRTYFEAMVDTISPAFNVKTTAQMTAREVRDQAAQFGAVAQAEPIKEIAAVERPATSSPAKIVLRSKEKASISFSAPPGTVLSSIIWTLKPVNNRSNKNFLETNLCLDLSGEEVCFTGVEDLAHCAFFTSCTTAFSSLTGTDSDGYVAKRYLAPGAAPVIRDGKITAKIQAPDIGTVLNIELALNIRAAESAPNR